MAVLEPQSNITLVNVPWDNNYQNVRNFNDIGAQTTYFSNLFPRINFEDYTFLRKGSSIRVGVGVDEIREYNYLYYNNGDGKTYYCFIEDYNYISENVTELIIKIDVYQTYMFEYTILKSFVEREHVTLSSDVAGNYTFPEELETGEYISREFTNVAETQNTYLIIQIGKNPYNNLETFNYTNKDGIMQFGYMFAYKISELTDTTSKEWNCFRDLIKKVRDQGISENIFAVYSVPYFVIGERYTNNLLEEKYPCMIKWDDTSYGSKNEIEKTFSPPFGENQFNYLGKIYTAKNNKLLTYPYKYLSVSNNVGALNTYRYENFKNGIPKFILKGVMSIGGSIKLIPENYNGQTRNENEGIILGKYPQFMWGNDVYTNWLTQNAINVLGDFIDVGLTFTKSGISLVGGGPVAGTSYAFSGMQKIISNIGNIYKHSFAPNTISGNASGGDINSSSSQNTFIISHNEIKPEYAEIIDNFFEMYGYKINKLKVPETTSRKYWNYVKTIDINMEGNIPETDLTELKNIFNTGVTIWHTDNMYNYSLNNHESI